jgi:ABC-type nitrate/sulfonate/bicarbonate transport system substrate-binding protein
MLRIKKNKLLCTILTVLSVAILIGVWLVVPTLIKKVKSSEKITIGVSDAVPELSALLYIVEKNKYFEGEGLDVVLMKELNGLVAQKDVLAGKIDVATTPDFAIVSDAFEYDNFRILTSIGKGDIIEILGRKDKNITKPADLKGKRVGYTPKSTAEYFLGRFLSFNNLSLKDVTLVPMAFDKIPQALESGQIDAAASINLFSYPIKQKMGDNVVSWSAQEGQDVLWLLVATADFTTKRPEAISKLLKALIKAEQYLKTNPVEGKSIVRERLNLDKDYFDEIWPRNKFEVSLDQSLLLNMQEEAQWIIANNLTDKTTAPHFQDFIFKDALKEIKHDAVTIY